MTYNLFNKTVQDKFIQGMIEQLESPLKARRKLRKAGISGFTNMIVMDSCQQPLVNDGVTTTVKVSW